MLIYIAGKLSDPLVTNYVSNCHKMIHWGNTIRKMGHSPYIPCMDFMLGLIDGNMVLTDFYKIGIDFMKVCDALLLMPNWKSSKGCKLELKEFKKLNRPIIDMTRKDGWNKLRELNNA